MNTVDGHSAQEVYSRENPPPSTGAALARFHKLAQDIVEINATINRRRLQNHDPLETTKWVTESEAERFAYIEEKLYLEKLLTSQGVSLKIPRKKCPGRIPKPKVSVPERMEFGSIENEITRTLTRPSIEDVTGHSRDEIILVLLSLVEERLHIDPQTEPDVDELVTQTREYIDGILLP